LPKVRGYKLVNNHSGTSYAWSISSNQQLSKHESFSVAIAGRHIPTMNGLALVAVVRAEEAKIKPYTIIMSSEQLANAPNATAYLGDLCRFLTKASGVVRR
jgi:hypothetical protein